MAKSLIERWAQESVGLKPVGSRKMTPEEAEKWKKRKQISKWVEGAIKWESRSKTTAKKS